MSLIEKMTAPLALFICCMPVSAETFPMASYHLTNGSPKKISATLTFQANIPHGTAAQWLFYLPAPPELPGQRIESVGFGAEGFAGRSELIQDLSVYPRPIMRLFWIPSNSWMLHNCLTRCNYIADLTPRDLVAGAPDTVAPPLSASDDRQYLSSSASINFSDPQFQGWLSANSLRKGKSERDIDFAWRTFLLMRKQFSYSADVNQDRTASVVCRRLNGDCGALSIVFVSAMRANGIPARSLFGRWAQSDDGNSRNSPFGQCHVKSEFYLPKVGWVPVEVSAATQFKNTPAPQYFGHYRGDFITMHIDPDIVLDTVWSGHVNKPVVQSPIFWWHGRGNGTGTQEERIWSVSSVN